MKHALVGDSSVSVVLRPAVGADTDTDCVGKLFHSPRRGPWQRPSSPQSPPWRWMTPADVDELHETHRRFQTEIDPTNRFTVEYMGTSVLSIDQVKEAVPKLAERFHGPSVIQHVQAYGGPTVWKVAHERAVPFEDLFRALRPVFEGLVVLADHGIVHGDVSPNNVLLGADGSARLIDLELCMPTSLAFGERDMRTRGSGWSYPYWPPEYLSAAVDPDRDATAEFEACFELSSRLLEYGRRTGALPKPWSGELRRGVEHAHKIDVYGLGMTLLTLMSKYDTPVGCAALALAKRMVEADASIRLCPRAALEAYDDALGTM